MPARTLLALALMASGYCGTATAQTTPASDQPLKAPKAAAAPSDDGGVKACPEYVADSCPKPPGKCHCDIVWLQHWKWDDVLKPVEPKPTYCGCKHNWLHNFLWCPPEEEEKSEDDAKAEDSKNGDEKKEEPKEEEPAEEEIRTPIMQMIHCWAPCCSENMKKRGDNIYGWIQQGYTLNPASPSDGINFGVNFNNRANYYQLNQAYLVFENLLDAKKGEWDYGYRLDMLVGTDAPFLAAFGLFDNVVNAADRGQDIGVDLPQFYGEVHLPYLTCNGIDVRVGKFYTPVGSELTPAPQTNFYSHSYMFTFGPFTHTGIWSTVRVTDTVNQSFGVVRGWDVFEDNNNRPSWMGQTLWTSCDKRQTFYVTYITGPEQQDNNSDYRTLIVADYIQKFGSCNQYQVILEAGYGYEANAPVPLTASPTGFKDAPWYGANSTFLYTLDPRVILGSRLEWFADPDGTRTGFENNYFEVTGGVAFRPYKNLWIRPEIRFDWADQTPVYNDLQDKWQFIAAVDVIYQF